MARRARSRLWHCLCRNGGLRLGVAIGRVQDSKMARCLVALRRDLLGNRSEYGCGSADRHRRHKRGEHRRRDDPARIPSSTHHLRGSAMASMERTPEAALKAVYRWRSGRSANALHMQAILLSPFCPPWMGPGHRWPIRWPIPESFAVGGELPISLDSDAVDAEGREFSGLRRARLSS